MIHQYNKEYEFPNGESTPEDDKEYSSTNFVITSDSNTKVFKLTISDDIEFDTDNPINDKVDNCVNHLNNLFKAKGTLKFTTQSDTVNSVYCNHVHYIINKEYNMNNENESRSFIDDLTHFDNVLKELAEDHNEVAHIIYDILL